MIWLGRLDAIRPAHHDCAPESLTELEAFIRMDQVLASLNKQYLEAKAHRKELVALNGADDAMAEVAMDMEDSAWCAMQTRYLELREDRDLMMQAQRLMRQADERVEEKREKEKQKEALNIFHRMQILKNMERQKKDRVPFFEIAFILLIFKLLPAGIDNHTQRFSMAA